MKRITLALLALLFAGAAHAQVVVMDYDMFQSNRNIKVKMSLKDAKSEEPLPFATVYLNPQGDTTITHFALSDQEGKVEIPDVPVGRYRLNVELIGYTPFVKDYNFRNYEEDLGVIKMEENRKSLTLRPLRPWAMPSRSGRTRSSTTPRLSTWATTRCSRT